MIFSTSKKKKTQLTSFNIPDESKRFGSSHQACTKGKQLFILEDLKWKLPNPGLLVPVVTGVVALNVVEISKALDCWAKL